MDRFKCSMCYFNCVSMKNLEKHIIRIHRNELVFKVSCCLCGATFRKFKSYKQHVNRYHPPGNFPQNNDVTNNEVIDIPNVPSE